MKKKVLILFPLLFTLSACARTPEDPYRAAVQEAVKKATSVTVVSSSCTEMDEHVLDDPERVRELAQLVCDGLEGTTFCTDSLPAGGGGLSATFYSGDEMLYRISMGDFASGIVSLHLPDHTLAGNPQCLHGNSQQYCCNNRGELRTYCSLVVAEGRNAACEDAN